jgi:hypothetical protein
MADDQGGVFLNGHALGGTEGSFSGPPAAFLDETPGDFINGTNRLQVVVYDTGGLTGTDYAGKASWNCRPAL